MTDLAATRRSETDLDTAHLKRIARVTGVLYLLLAIAGAIGFLYARSTLYVAGDPAATLDNLSGNEPLARLGLAMELTVVLVQLLVALAFYRLFRRVSTFAAGALVGFAFLGAMCVLTAVMAYSQALDVALGSGGAPGGDRAATSLLMFDLSAAAWNVGDLLFGLWLIPMGYLAYVSRYMPRALGVIVMAGGVGYVLSAYIGLTWPHAPAAVEGVLLGVATVGELWMVAHLLIVGVLRGPRRDVAPSPEVARLRSRA